MAQTVTMRRGTTSFTTGGSYNTIFTMSTGTAARIIPVVFTMYFTNALNISGNNYMYIKVNSSAGGGQIISMQPNVNYQGSSIRQIQLNSTANQAGFGVQSLGTGGGQQATASLLSSNSGYLESMGYVSITIAYNLSASQPQGLPNFWMGSGDSLQIKVLNQYQSGKSNINNTMQLAYSFVEIAES